MNELRGYFVRLRRANRDWEELNYYYYFYNYCYCYCYCYYYYYSNVHPSDCHWRLTCSASGLLKCSQ